MPPEDVSAPAGTPDNPLAVVPAGDAVPSVPLPTFDARGKFAPGNKMGGRKRGALDRVSQAMKEAYESFMADQTDKDRFNPLIILAKIAGSPDQSNVNLEVKSMAAFRLWKMIVPKQLEITGPDGGPVEIETGNDFAEALARLPQIRAVMEAAQEDTKQ